MKKLPTCLLLLGMSLTSLADGPTVFVTLTPTPSLRLTWSPSPDPSVVGYRFYDGVVPGQYTNSSTLPYGRGMTNYPPITNYSQVPPWPMITGMDTNRVIYFSVTAYATNGSESVFAQEVRVGPEYWATNAPVVVPPPTLPTNTVKLAWDHSPEFAANPTKITYRLYYQTNSPPTTNWPTINCKMFDTGTNITFTQTNVDRTVIATWACTAVGAAGDPYQGLESPISNWVILSPLPPESPPSTNLPPAQVVNIRKRP